MDPIEIQFLMNLALSVVLGYFIGAERESRGKDAGYGLYVVAVVAGLVAVVIPRIPHLKKKKGGEKFDE